MRKRKTNVGVVLGAWLRRKMPDLQAFGGMRGAETREFNACGFECFRPESFVVMIIVHGRQVC